MPVNNSTVGANIRTARRERGLSQAAFAKLVGVSFSSQRRYERGESSPDTEYLASLKRCGIDVDFVLRGGPETTPSDFENWKTISLLEKIIVAIGVRLGRDFEAINNDVLDYTHLDGPIKDLDEPVPTWLIDLFFDGCSLEVDSSLLASVIEGVEVAASKGEMGISSVKKAQAIAMLYRTFKPSGKIDPALIEDTVKLASS